MVHETAKPEVFCKFGTCVARIWTGLVKSVATLRGSTPPNGNCGMELLELPSPPPTTFPALFHAGGMKVISKIPGLKTLKKTYDAAKECRALQKAMPGN